MGSYKGYDRTHVGWSRLWAATGADATHAIDPGALGEYAELRLRDGQAAAKRAFPEVAKHLASGCQRCNEDLSALTEILHEEKILQEKEEPSPSTWGGVAAAHVAEQLAPAWPTGPSAPLRNVTATPTFEFRFHEFPDIALRILILGGNAFAHVSRETSGPWWEEPGLVGWRIEVISKSTSKPLSGVTDALGIAYLGRASGYALEHASVHIHSPT
jgi:hypothetical protein